MTRRPTLAAVTFSLLTACSGADDTTGLGVVVRDVHLPVSGAVYHGSSAHLFAGGSARLTCSSHGGFTSAVDPPQQVGTPVQSDYTATFVGELVLEPPLVSSPATYSLSVQAQMGERITLASVGNGQRVFDTELVTFELSAGMPTDVVVRQSPALRSVGVTTITATSDGLNRVESRYDVWLEISVDAGRTWTEADAAVRMTLQSS